MTFDGSLPPNNREGDDKEEVEVDDDDDDDEDDLEPLLDVLHGGGRCGGTLNFRGLLYLCLFQYNLKVKSSYYNFQSRK